MCSQYNPWCVIRRVGATERGERAHSNSGCTAVKTASFTPLSGRRSCVYRFDCF